MPIVTSCFYMSIVTYCFYMYHIFTFLIFLLVYCDARTAPSVPIKAYIIIIIIMIVRTSAHKLRVREIF